MTTYSKETKPVTVFTYEERAGEAGNNTWDDAVALWDDTINNWDDVLLLTVFNKESKPVTVFSKETKP